MIRTNIGLKICSLLFLVACFFIIQSSHSMGEEVPLPGMDPKGYPAPDTGCLAPNKCHGGIEPIRAHNSGMAKEIYASGNKLGDTNGCVVCHGGDPAVEEDAKKAHEGAPDGSTLEALVLLSASVWVTLRGFE